MDCTFEILKENNRIFFRSVTSTTKKKFMAGTVAPAFEKFKGSNAVAILTTFSGWSKPPKREYYKL